MTARGLSLGGGRKRAGVWFSLTEGVMPMLLHSDLPDRWIVLAGFSDAKEKVSLLAASEIADPAGGSSKDFEKCRIDIQNALLELLPKLKLEL